MKYLNKKDFSQGYSTILDDYPSDGSRNSIYAKERASALMDSLDEFIDKSIEAHNVLVDINTEIDAIVDEMIKKGNSRINITRMIMLGEAISGVRNEVSSFTSLVSESGI